MHKGHLNEPKLVHFVDMKSSKPKKPIDLYRVDTSFHFSIWPVLVLAQCFCMMPISGVRCTDLEYERASGRLKFRWRSIRVVWTIVYLGFGTYLTYLYLHRLNDTGVTAKNIGLFLFITSRLFI